MFKINLNYTRGYSDTQLIHLQRALSLFETVMNSPQLKTNILNFRSPAGNTFIDNDGLSNEQVYSKLLSGTEQYDPTADTEADLILILVKKRRPPFVRNPAIGYGMPGQKEIYTYSFYFNSASPASLAGHVAHEWSHKLGFHHAFHSNDTRNYSVPYAFGYMVNEIAEQY